VSSKEGHVHTNQDDDLFYGCFCESGWKFNLVDTGGFHKPMVYRIRGYIKDVMVQCMDGGGTVPRYSPATSGSADTVNLNFVPSRHPLTLDPHGTQTRTPVPAACGIH
jgi:hypothetical protein